MISDTERGASSSISEARLSVGFPSQASLGFCGTLRSAQEQAQRHAGKSAWWQAVPAADVLQSSTTRAPLALTPAGWHSPPPRPEGYRALDIQRSRSGGLFLHQSAAGQGPALELAPWDKAVCKMHASSPCPHYNSFVTVPSWSGMF